MTVKTIKNFVSTNQLQDGYNELTSSPNWRFHKTVWRYHLIPNLKSYNELDSSTWYCNQHGVSEQLKYPWRGLFDDVLSLAGPRFQLMRYGLVGQTQGQSGTGLHKDVQVDLSPGRWRSYVIYLNPEYDSHWGGSTEIQLPDGTWHFEYPEPGKLIEFDSQLLHQSMSPLVPNVLRTTIVLHGYLS